jgi:hypothetical protein
MNPTPTPETWPVVPTGPLPKSVRVEAVEREEQTAAFIDLLIRHLQCARYDLPPDPDPEDHQSATGAHLWTVFDLIWMERTGLAKPVSTQVLKFHGLSTCN